MLRILALLLIMSACSTTPNNFSEQANVFLDTLSSANFNGTGDLTGTVFISSGAVLSTKGAPASSEFKDRRSLRFQNSRNNGVSQTEGIYRQEKTPDIPTFDPPPAGEIIRYVGIVFKENKLLHTPFIDEASYANEPENLNWESLTEFASR